jgi:hypothetical protein
MSSNLITCFFGLIIICYSATYSLTAKITVMPDTLLEVGQEIVFSAEQSVNVAIPQQAHYAWDFGDGYCLKQGCPGSRDMYDGPNCLHIFMKSGTFKVKLLITEMEGNKDSTSVNIHVSGDAPMTGFEAWHAPYYCRIRQFIYVQIPEEITKVEANGLKVTISNKNAFSKVLIDKTGLKKEEKFLFNNSELLKGDYSILFELLDASKKTTSYIKEMFSKPYDGIPPKTGIDEYNSLYRNGKPFFPVTPWIKNAETFKDWAYQYINSTYVVGYYEKHSAANWLDYLNHCQEYSLPAIGPERWEGRASQNLERNSYIQKLMEYVTTAKDHPMLFMWMWKDEPDLGSQSEEIPTSVLASWTYASHVLDPQHPVCTNQYGYNYLPYYTGLGSQFDYLSSDKYFGGKKYFSFDVGGFDIYPLEKANHASLNSRRIMSEYVTAIDTYLSKNYNLIPSMSFVEVQDTKEAPTPAPTPSQIVMEAWLNVVHGIKGINWFHEFGATPESGFMGMSRFYSQIAIFAPAVLAPPRDEVKVTDDANDPSKRVDLLARKYGKDSDTALYIFAIRLTEPDSSQYNPQFNEPDSIQVTFTVEGFSGSTVEVENKSKQLQITGGKFTDWFKKYDICIYRIGPKLLEKPLNAIRPLKEMKQKDITKMKKLPQSLYRIDGKKLDGGNQYLNRSARKNLPCGIYLILDSRQKTNRVFIP